VAALALAASGGVAVLSAAGPAAADTPAPVSSSGYSLSISVATKSIHPGSSDTVSGVLTRAGAAASGDTVYLRARLAGKKASHRVSSGTTGGDGAVSFTVTPSTNTHYRLVLRLPSAVTPAPVPAGIAVPTTVAARSKVATVHVLRDSSLSIRARLAKNGTERVAGQLRGGGHGLARRDVALQERAIGAAAWTTVATKRTKRHGVVGYNVAAASTSAEYQLVFAGGANFSASQSGVVTDNAAG
jgi:hypothetical protein